MLKQIIPIICWLFFFSQSAAQDWDRNFWIDKSARQLSAGKNHLSNQEISDLAQFTDDEIIEKLIQNPYSSESILKFNLYFLGHSPEYTSTTQEYIDSTTLAKAPSALNSAIEFYKSGNFFNLFKYEQPLYVNTQADTGTILSELNALSNMLNNDSPNLPADFCPTYKEITNRPQGLKEILPAALLPEFFFSRQWFQPLKAACSGPVTNVAEKLRLHFPKLLTKLEILFSRMKQLQRDAYNPKRLLEYKNIPIEDLDLNFKLFNSTLGTQLPNLLANLNRKRGAYVLKQFFCDSLAVSPSVESTNSNDPSLLLLHQNINNKNLEPQCLSCHARLDPISGFFKDNGATFLDMSFLPIIRLDGDDVLNRSEYQNNWRNSDPTSERKWNIAYMRSEKDLALNSYGENLRDLSKILSTAPEVRFCLTKKLYEYYVGPNQLVDQAYLHKLAKNFDSYREEESSKAVVQILSEIVKGKAFRERRPDPQICYDSLNLSEESLPCEISYALQENCVKCHSNTRNGIDLSSWHLFEDGSRGFLHLDENDQQLSRRKSFELILERITSNDPTLSMPKNAKLSISDKEALQRWLFTAIQNSKVQNDE